MKTEEKTTRVCAHCGCTLGPDEGVIFDDTLLCEDCLENETFLCSSCMDRHWVEDNAGSTDLPLCEDCRDRRYTTCSDCGCLIELDEVRYGDDDDPYCYDCYQDVSSVIHNYSYKPAPVFHGAGDRYFGIELEVDEGGQLRNKARQLLGIANRDYDNLYIKTDGSLDDGFELVTHPMTYEYHLTRMPWKAVLTKAIQLGYLSHRTRTCGLHIHINRDSFGATEEAQESCIGRIMYLVERFWEELLRFSRRTPAQLDRWAARYGYKDKPQEILDHAKKGYSDRYVCVNIQNEDTIEIRIFKGTLKYNTVIATLQLVHELCNVATFYTDEDVKELSWCSFMERLDPTLYPELIRYLKERRLYINEPVGEDEDA